MRSAETQLKPALFVCAALLVPSLAAAQGDDAPVRVAFSVEPAEAAPGSTVEVRVTATIDTGWHIYGAKETQGVPSKLEVTPGRATKLAGGVLTPTPHMEDVPYVGKMALLRGEVVFRQRVTLAPDAAGEVLLPVALTYQACSEGEGGMCLPPETPKQVLKVNVAADDGSAGASPGALPGDGADDGLAWMDPAFGGGGEEAVTARVTVYPPRAPPGSWVEVRVTAVIGDDWHIYGVHEQSGLPTSLSLQLPEGLLAGGGLLEDPAPIPKTDPNIGPTLNHHGVATFTQKVQVFPDSQPGDYPIGGTLEWQACDPSRCVPGSFDVQATLTVDPAAPATGVAPPQVDSGTPGGGVAPKGPKASEPLGFFGLLLASVGFGLAMLVMPCTYPMIPITVSLFSKGRSLSRAESMFRAGVYALGIVVSFVLVGGLVQVLFAAAGQDALNSLATNAWVNLIIGAIFVYFAGSFFGYYELGLPAPLMRLMQFGQGKRDSDGTVPTWSLFLMGLFFVLTAYTCGAPVIFSLFATAASASPGAILGSTFVFAVTVALPFFALALVPGGMRLLPKSGSWFTVFKVVMAFVELGFAVKFFRGTDLQWELGILPRSATLGIWTVLAVATALYLHGYFPFKFPHQPDLKAWSPRRYGWGWAFVLAAGYFAYGAAGHELNSRIEAFVLPDPEVGEDEDTIVFGLPYHKDLAHLDAALARAKETGKPAFLLFTGHYCPNCVQMEKAVLPDERVMEKLKDTGRVALFIDKADDPAEQAHRKLMFERYNPGGAIPCFFVIDGDGNPLSSQIGNCSVDAFLEFLSAGGL